MRLTVCFMMLTVTCWGQSNTFPSSGYAGAGTTSPQAQLHVVNSDPRQLFRLYWSGSTANYLSIWQGSGAAILDPIGTGELRLGYDQTTNVTMGVTNTGVNNVAKLGVGTPLPLAKLHVIAPSALTGDNTVKFEAPSIGGNASHVHYGTSGDWYIRSANGSGKVVIQDTGGLLGVGTVSPAGKVDISHAGGQLRLSGGAVAGGVWTDAADKMYLADWATGSKGLNINMTSGYVGIGTTSPDAKLSVKGQVHAQEVKVDLNGAVAPDYVFNKDYKLPSLDELKSYIEKNNHLPEVPSANELEENGLNLGEMNLLLLKKVEELTLYIMQQDFRLRQLESKSKEK